VGQPDFSPRKVRLAVTMLIAAVAVEFFHRQLLAIAVQPIQDDLGFSDTRMGVLLTGFAAAYAVSVLALGRRADATDRRSLYALSVAVWSGATALAAAVSGFGAFLATRLGVGLGQAGAGATNGPLIADYVPPERRATVMGLNALGATVGVFLSGTLGSFAISVYGWRATFVVGGGLGFVFAALFRWLVDEPPRGWSEGRTEETGERPSLGEAVATIAGLRTFRHMLAGAILTNMSLFAGAQWGTAFFQRVHGLSIEQAGPIVAGVALMATFGAVAGGLLSDRLWTRNLRGVMLAPAACTALAFPTAASAFYADALPLTVAFFAASTLLALVHAAPVGAATQALAPLRIRGMISAVMNSLLVLFGLGIGPLVTGWASDRIAGVGSGEGLRVGLAGISALYLWAAVHFFLAARTLPEELRRSGGGGGAV